MRIKEFFTVPEGTRVTDKMFGRVLLSTICGILLCMVCLGSTTWAWFVVGIENTGNEIQIARVNTDVTLTLDGNLIGETADGGYSLAAGTYTVDMKLYNEAKAPVYLLMTVTQNGSTFCYGIPFATGESSAVRQLEIKGWPATAHFSTSWFMPASVLPYGDGAVTVNVPPPAPAQEDSQPTQESLAPVGESQNSTSPDT